MIEHNTLIYQNTSTNHRSLFITKEDSPQNKTTSHTKDHYSFFLIDPKNKMVDAKGVEF